MQYAIEQLIENLPGHDVDFRKRPDGMLLMTLSKDGEAVFSKAIDRQTVVCEKRVKALLHEIMRDHKLVSGEINWKGQGAQWIDRSLPTFTGAPINPTAAKMMWARRNLENGYRATA
ncbi:hypothetical protein [Phytopseudomonas dryadis]|uniref:DUF3509 domain-containing protein n=1 Tax=Phytopseudomonas dryadis TaxID=2487520 RepID=A0A4Q9QW37_9GAMM|nr:MULTISPECIES: hypothetical protein [Pseudomonas]TBU87152.1 hypothetical protein DNK44_20975 [Pseudomonas dryadis]TBV01824.1 hypothetical protein DNK34_20450 [Pseudomonas dryadis]TBV14444.1 hypothetical protein DNK41_20390 [Pseudomonas sp. FRB 230]